MDLFSHEKRVLQLPNAELIYIPNFYSQEIATSYFDLLLNSVAWQQDEIKIYGKTYQQPRLTALFASNNQPYSYSNITMIPKPLTSELSQIKHDVEQASEHSFTSVLLNLYRDGNDSNGWHADNEKELGTNPIIASVSFGEARVFQFKHRDIKQETHKLLLEHGSLLLMKGEMQHYWLHQIAKTKKPMGRRINLTFRTLKTL